MLFADSFEQSEWNGNWVEDGQNDWARRTQRAADGAYSAEVDGSATNATLSMSNPLDLTSYTSAELTFSWYLESGFDGGEYIALDLYNGSDWNEVASLQGNLDQENMWHDETITIDGSYLIADFQSRFRAKVSRSNEDGFVDNVKITGTPIVNEPTAEFVPLGFLTGQSHSSSFAVSTDGQFVVGRSGDEAFSWSRSGGMIHLGTFIARDVSADGSVVVGDDGGNNYAYRWDNGTLSVIGDLTTIGRTEADPGGIRMNNANSVSADGSVVVGNTGGSDFKGEADSFRIVGSDIQPIGDLPGGAHNSGANDVSADGSVVVGRGNSANGPDEAYRWENGTFTPLGELPGGVFDSHAWEVSGNGQFVVGHSESAAGVEAFLWSSETGMVGLGHLPGETTDSRARGVSGDGSLVVGSANENQSPELRDAFIWDAVKGMRNLQNVLVTDYGLGDALAGWTLNLATAISDDGLIISGTGTNPNGLREAFLVELDAVANAPPTAGAGVDQSLSDNDATGSESITIVGSASDPDGTVDSYEWSDGTNILGTSPALTTNLSVGVHTLTLTATDNEGATGSDSVVITVVANQGPTANAGQDLSVVDSDNSGSEVVTVNGSGTDSDGSILSYEWKEGTTPLGNTATVTPDLSVGTHTLTLTVMDNGGATAVDTVIVTVSAASSEVVLFEDSFEVGSNSNDWNGKWVEDSQNDYFRSTQRSTDGVRSAEVDGSASDATLTISSAQDISSYGYASLTFDWYIERGFDLNEYLSLDISANGGGSWSFDVRRLDGGKGTASRENTWFSEAVDLAPYSSSNLLIRFRTYVSSSREDANIDTVRIVAGSSSAAPMAPGPIVAKSEPQQFLTNAGFDNLLTHASDSTPAAATQFALPSLGSAELASMSPTAIDEVLAGDRLFDDLALVGLVEDLL